MRRSLNHLLHAPVEGPRSRHRTAGRIRALCEQSEFGRPPMFAKCGNLWVARGARTP
jgi:hypothetical protein